MPCFALVRSYLNILLLCLPIGIWAGLAGKGALMVFSMVGACACFHPAVLISCVCKPEQLAAMATLMGSSRGKRLHAASLCSGPPNSPLPRSPAHPTLQNFLALIPLALFLGEVTEDLAVRFGDIIGGLLNATFGNVVEL